MDSARTVGRLVIAVLAAASILAAGCRDRTLSDPADLGVVEVREYEGEDLSSITEFRENSIKGPQEVDRDTYRLKVTGLVDAPLSLTYRDVIDKQQSYKKVVRLSCVEGWSVNILWEGVRLSDLLDQAGADPDARVVIFRSVDGYSTSLPADYIRENDILLAYRMNDVELPPDRGFPFQLVAQEKWGYKWAKWITEIEVSDDTSFRGYWESRGYENDADS
ncbi:MAG: molybdopterin-dependent oxidoreductase [Coriobacteriia bacterium]